MAVVNEYERRTRDCGDLPHCGAVRVRAAQRVAGGAADRRMLPLVSFVVQNLERSDRWRQRLYVATGESDGLADGCARRNLHAMATRWPAAPSPRGELRDGQSC